MIRVLMIVLFVITLVGMTFESFPVLVLMRVSMFVCVPVLVRVPGVAMQMLMRVGVSMPVCVLVSMFLFFFHIDLPVKMAQTA